MYLQLYVTKSYIMIIEKTNDNLKMLRANHLKSSVHDDRIYFSELFEA